MRSERQRLDVKMRLRVVMVRGSVAGQWWPCGSTTAGSSLDRGMAMEEDVLIFYMQLVEGFMIDELVGWWVLALAIKLNKLMLFSDVSCRILSAC